MRNRTILFSVIGLLLFILLSFSLTNVISPTGNLDEPAIDQSTNQQISSKKIDIETKNDTEQIKKSSAPVNKVVIPIPQNSPPAHLPPQCQKVTVTKADRIPASESDRELLVKSDNIYFEVFGYTDNQIRDQLDICGPFNEYQNKTYDAVTYGWWDFAYNLKDSINKCKVSDIKITLHIVYIFPKWSAVLESENGLVEKWQNYIKNLEIHESVHGDIFKKNIDKALLYLKNVPEGDNCNNVGPAVENILDENQKESDLYDSETNHGATQGAIFP